MTKSTVDIQELFGLIVPPDATAGKNGTLFELGAVRLLRMDSGLLRVAPTEQRHQLVFGGAGFGAALRAELA